MVIRSARRALSAEGGFCRAVLSSRHLDVVIAWFYRRNDWTIRACWGRSRKREKIGDCAVRRSRRCRCALPGARLRISGAAARSRSVRSMQDRGCGPSRRSFRAHLSITRGMIVRASGRSTPRRFSFAIQLAVLSIYLVLTGMPDPHSELRR